MNYNLLKTLSVLTGCALFGVLTAQAQDKATLDLLVKKGVISQSDADSIAKTSGTPIVATKSSTVQKIQLEGMIQFDYNDLTASDDTKNANPVATNQMYFRRVMMGAKVDLGNDWGGEIMMDFAAGQIADQPKSGLSPQAYPTTASTVGGQQGIQYISQDMFDKIAITKQIPGYGQFEAGYDKTNWVQEEMTPTSQLPAIERSIATRYFDEYYGSQTAYRLAFGQRRTGLFWNGTADGIPGLYYSAALTDGIQSQINFTNVGGLDKIGAWTGAGFKGKNDDMGLTYDFGLNLGYSGDGNSQNTIKSSATIYSPYTGLAAPVNQTAQSNDTYGYNPYIKVAVGNFSLLAEFFQSRFENGRSTIPYTSTLLTAQGIDSAAWPYGINIIPVYKITPDLDIDLRLSYLDTNGRGTDQNGVMWNAPNDVAGSINANTGLVTAGQYGPLFDNAKSIYLGFNWALSPGVRFSAGVERVWFNGRQTYTATNGTSDFDGPGTVANNIRAQLTVSW